MVNRVAPRHLVAASWRDAARPPDRPVTVPALRVGMVGTYPPTECGIATFTRNLRAAIGEQRPEWQLPVVRLLEDEDTPALAEVAASWVRGRPRTLEGARRTLAECDVAIVQHEFGIFDGPDGDAVINLVDDLRTPLVVVFHTILTTPSRRQRRIMTALLRRAALAVTPSSSALERLRATYWAPRSTLVPHGASDNFAASPGERRTGDTVLTWGLLGPGKGLESAIEAVSRLGDLRPPVTYVIAGHTHPHVRARGDDYRQSLVDVAARLGVADRVRFDDQYRDRASLNALIRSADVVLLPYESRDQVCSGVLVEALASARPVVATRFPHAVELLSDGAGILVPHGDVDAMSRALRRVLRTPGVAGSLSSAAREVGETLVWPRVGEQFARHLAAVAATARPAEGGRR